MIADAVYAKDNQATLARWYGKSLATGSTVEDVQSWTDQVRAVTADQVRAAARAWLDKHQSVTGYLIREWPKPGEEILIATRPLTVRIAAALAFSVLMLAPARAATEVERVVSPLGIEAWLVHSPTAPLIAIDFAFRGGSSQDPADKAGVASLVAGLIDEGAGDFFNSRAFHEQLEANAIGLSFSASRDQFNGSLRTLLDRQDKAFDFTSSP